MGVIRKCLSISTLGLIDFRSDKERIARSTRHTAKQSKRQTELLQERLEAQHQGALQAQSVAQSQILTQEQVGRQAQSAALTADLQRQALLEQARSSERTTAVIAAAPSLAERIIQLDALLAEGLITSEQHATRKQAILDSI